jgi:hypothetical protein
MWGKLSCLILRHNCRINPKGLKETTKGVKIAVAQTGLEPDMLLI